jgi:hypothetical protein
MAEQEQWVCEWMRSDEIDVEDQWQAGKRERYSEIQREVERERERESERERKDLGAPLSTTTDICGPKPQQRHGLPVTSVINNLKSKINLQVQDQQLMSMASSRGSQHQKKGSSFTMAVKKKVKIIDRPLNSYNLYFILERALFLQSKGAKSWKEEDRRLSLNFHEYCDLELPPFPMRYQSVCVTF